MHSDLRRIGHFTCSDERLNRLHENAVWSWRGNRVGVPTDCPQRDERLGWTGDLAVFAPSAAYLFDVGPFLREWLVDLALEQEHADGRVPLCAPDCLKFEPPPEGVAADGHRGDLGGRLGVGAVGALDGVRRPHGRCATSGPRCSPTSSGSAAGCPSAGSGRAASSSGTGSTRARRRTSPGRSKADTGVVATAVYFRTLTLAAATAAVIGEHGEASRIAGLAARCEGRVQRALRRRRRPRAQRLPDRLRARHRARPDRRRPAQRAGDRLAELVRADGHRIGTGFAGTAFVLDALTTTGHLEEAYALLTQTECPSWLYPVTMGATTVWERWDSMLPDGSVNPGAMTSFNHYALGSVADWLHRTIGGLAPLEPGYRRFRVAPRPGGGLIHAATSLETPYGAGAGRLAGRWRTPHDHGGDPPGGHLGGGGRRRHHHRTGARHATRSSRTPGSSPVCGQCGLCGVLGTPRTGFAVAGSDERRSVGRGAGSGTPSGPPPRSPCPAQHERTCDNQRSAT